MCAAFRASQGGQAGGQLNRPHCRADYSWQPRAAPKQGEPEGMPPRWEIRFGKGVARFSAGRTPVRSRVPARAMWASSAHSVGIVDCRPGRGGGNVGERVRVIVVVPRRHRRPLGIVGSGDCLVAPDLALLAELAAVEVPAVVPVLDGDGAAVPRRRRDLVHCLVLKGGGRGGGRGRAARGPGKGGRGSGE